MELPNKINTPDRYAPADFFVIHGNNMKKIKDALEDLANIIAPFDENASKYFRNIKNRNPQDIANDNNLWGGSGSYMDQGLYGQSTEMQEIFQQAAINLGKTIIESGSTSSRMVIWINAFDTWVNKKNV